MDGRGRPAQSPPPETSAFIRDYVVTGGRTRGRHRLSADTMLTAGAGRPRRALAEAEYQQITDLCRVRRRSVAELAGTVGLPLNVARVLISDLVDARVLDLYLVEGSDYERIPGHPLEKRPTSLLLEKLRVGLERLPA
ncbi:DUF742 domain-containing protein [Streptomyces sp. NPDC048420]|uniref:DUF742 domain-containing protein n=1 Tax=Streptomyces sp. NPDC048420 TaxID=3155755 RepID=UPI00343E449C